MTMNTDRIEKRVLLHAPRSRVWQALTNASEFGEWFKVKLEGGFAPGQKVRGKITHPGYEHLTMELRVERMDPEELFSFRWHPYAIDPNINYARETPTLVQFELEESEEDTWLTVTESGFDKLPGRRRSEAFRMNDQGWSEQIKNIERHIELVRR